MIKYCIVIFLLLSFSLQSQDIHEPMRNLEMIKLWRMVEFLDLNADQLASIITIHKEYSGQTSDLHKNRMELISELKEGIIKNPPAANLNSLVENIINIDSEIYRLREEERDKVFEIFTPLQQAKYYVFQVEFAEEVRRNLERLRDIRR